MSGAPKIDVLKRNTLTGHKDCVYTIEKSIVPGHFFSSGGDGLVVEWDLDKPESGRVLAKVQNSVYSLCLDEKNKCLILGQNYEGIHLLNLENTKEERSLQLTKTSYFDIKTCGNYVLVGDQQGTVHVIDNQSMTVVHKIQDSNKSVRTIAVNSENGVVCVGYSDNHIRIYDQNSFSLLHDMEGHQNSVFSTVFDPSSNYLLSAGRDAHLKVWDSTTCLEQQDIVAHMYTINDICYSPDSQHFATCSMDKSIKIWDAKSYQLLKVIDKGRHAGHGTSVNKLLWLPYKNSLISCSDDRTVSVWDLKFNM